MEAINQESYQKYLATCTEIEINDELQVKIGTIRGKLEKLSITKTKEPKSIEASVTFMSDTPANITFNYESEIPGQIYDLYWDKGFTKFNCYISVKTYNDIVRYADDVFQF